MKKKLALLLAGVMTLSILLSACGSGSSVEDPDPDVVDTTAPSASVEPTDAPETEEPAAVSTPSAEPTEEPSEEPSETPESAEPSQAAVQTAAPTPASATQAPAVVSTPAPSTPAPVASTPQPTPAPTPAPPAATKEAAMAYIGQSVSSLIAAIGQPNSRNYAPSCLGDGEDGELFYNGFTVYTYREGGVETVEDVI